MEEVVRAIIMDISCRVDLGGKDGGRERVAHWP